MADAGRTEPTTDDDPDAPWRPGYVGPEPRPADRPTRAAPPTRIETTSSWVPPNPWERSVPDVAAPAAPDAPAIDDEAGDSGRRQPVDAAVGSGRSSSGIGVALAGVVVVAVVVVAALIAVALVRNDGRDGLVAIPLDADVLWTADVTGDAPTVVTADGLAVIATSDEVVAYDGHTGAHRWRWTDLELPERPTLAVADGVVVLFDETDQELGRVTGLDLRSGRERWVRRPADGHAVFVVAGRMIEVDFESGANDGGADIRFALIDPATGLPSEGWHTVDTETVTSPPLVAIIEDGLVGVFDLRIGARVGPLIPSGEADALAIAGAALVGRSDEGRLLLFDDEGSVVDELDIGTPSPRIGNLWGLDGGELVVVGAGASSVGVSATTDGLDETWSLDGELVTVAATGAGARALLVDGGGDGRAQLVDPIAGKVVADFDVDDRRFFLADEFTFGEDGFVIDGTDAVVGLDLDGGERWRIPGPNEDLAVGDGVVVVVDADAVRAYG